MNLQRMQRLAGIKLNESISTVPGIGNVAEGARPNTYEVPAAWRKSKGDAPLTPKDVQRHDYEDKISSKETLAKNSKPSEELSESNITGFADIDSEIMRILQSVSDSFGDSEEGMIEVSRYLLDQGFDNSEVLQCMDTLENYLHDEHMRANMGDTDVSDNMLQTSGLDDGSEEYANSFDEEVGIDDLFDEEPEEDEEEIEDDGFCTACDGTGEGQYDGAACSSCGGKGFIRGTNDDDFNEPDAFDTGYDDGYFEESDSESSIIHSADGNDYFPSGSDSSAVTRTGPSGSRYGDNPEQKGMSIVAEVHKELVYNYRSFLNESAKKQKESREQNLDAAQREMDSREAEGEDMSEYEIDKTTYKIKKKSK